MLDVIYYDDDHHLHRILKTRTDAAMPAVVLLPRSLWWLVADKKFIKNDKHSQAAGMAAEKR